MAAGSEAQLHYCLQSCNVRRITIVIALQYYITNAAMSCCDDAVCHGLQAWQSDPVDSKCTHPVHEPLMLSIMTLQHFPQP